MRAGAGRAGGLTDVVRAQLERRQDHPNTGRDALLVYELEVSHKAQVETAEKRKEKKTAWRVRAGALHSLATAQLQK